ncbi:O-antigen ligase family protein [Francisellaceae bacterium]|nr:O-antigen ligase family protein [Francisellaceae bacterium]
MLVLLALIIFCLFVLGVSKPTYYIIVYVLISTKFLGFWAAGDNFLLFGFGVFIPLVNLVTLISALCNKRVLDIPRKAIWFTLGLVSFFLYGLFYPVFVGYEGFMSSIIASKSFWVVSLWVYLVVYRPRLDIDRIIEFIKFVGVYIACIYIFYTLFSIAPPYYLDGSQSVRASFPTYMMLAMFFYYFQWRDGDVKKIKLLIMSSILFLGILLVGRKSCIITIIISFSLLAVMGSRGNFNFQKIVLFIIIALVGIFLLSFTPSYNKTYHRVVSVANSQDSSLSSRNIYNQFRWDAINKSPLLGYGFMYKDTKLVKQYRNISNNRFSERFGVVDSGYVDLLIKFGFIGLFLYFMLWARQILPILLRPRKYDWLKISMSIYLLQYFFIDYTWSVLTYSFGLIPAFLALYLMIFGLNKRV